MQHLDAPAAKSAETVKGWTMAVPQAHMLSSIGYLATGSFPFVGGAQVEAKVTDAATGEVLAVAADHLLGGGNVSTAFQTNHKP